MKKILYTFNEILKQRDWILIRFTFYDHILTGFWTYSMPIAIRTMENNPPPPPLISKINFFSNNMRRLHGHRTFTDMTNSTRPSFNSARRCIQRKTRNEWHYYQTCHKEKIILKKLNINLIYLIYLQKYLRNIAYPKMIQKRVSSELDAYMYM